MRVVLYKEVFFKYGLFMFKYKFKSLKPENRKLVLAVRPHLYGLRLINNPAI